MPGTSTPQEVQWYQITLEWGNVSLYGCDTPLPPFEMSALERRPIVGTLEERHDSKLVSVLNPHLLGEPPS